MVIKEKGKWVVVEGGVGAGKSRLLYRFRFEEKYDNWEFFREPGSTAYGEKVRDAIQGLHDYAVSPTAAMLGYNSARANLVEYGIRPTLLKGKNAMLDRYWYSTWALQGAYGESKLAILVTSWLATGGLLPDLSVYLDLDPVIGTARKAGKLDIDRHDIMPLEFHQRVRRNYRQLAWLIPRWVTLDASKPADEVYANFEAELKRRKII